MRQGVVWQNVVVRHQYYNNMGQYVCFTIGNAGRSGTRKQRQNQEDYPSLLVDFPTACGLSTFGILFAI